MTEDWEAWQRLHVDNLWYYDKLILSRKLGYTCGPVGVPVPFPGEYVVRPITNIMGMGRQAEVHFLKEDTDHLPIGHFWCEKFEGRHFSVDYLDGIQVLCVEGIRSGLDLYRWDKWIVVSNIIPYPLKEEFGYLNCEFIGDKLIEVHFRLNPDFENINSNELIVVWNDMDEREVPEGYYFKEDRDWKRRGFFVKENL